MIADKYLKNCLEKMPGVESVEFDYINNNCSIGIVPCVWAAYILFGFQPISIPSNQYEDFITMSNLSKYFLLCAEREMERSGAHEVKMTLRMDDFAIIDNKMNTYDYDNFIKRGERIFFLHNYTKDEHDILRDGLLESVSILFDYLTFDPSINQKGDDLNRLILFLKDKDTDSNYEDQKKKIVDYLMDLIDKGYVYIDSLEKMYAFIAAVEERKG